MSMAHASPQVQKRKDKVRAMDALFFLSLWRNCPPRERLAKRNSHREAKAREKLNERIQEAPRTPRFREHNRCSIREMPTSILIAYQILRLYPPCSVDFLKKKHECEPINGTANGTANGTVTTQPPVNRLAGRTRGNSLSSGCHFRNRVDELVGQI